MPVFQFQLGKDPVVLPVEVTLLGLEFPTSGGHNNHPVLQRQLTGAGGGVLAYGGFELAAVPLEAHQFALGENGDIGMPKYPGLQVMQKFLGINGRPGKNAVFGPRPPDAFAAR